MKNIFILVLFSLALCTGVFGQGGTTQTTSTTQANTEKKKRPPIFRASKVQVKQVQTLLKDKTLYTGETTGKLDDTTRASIRLFQKDNGLKSTGTLNRATLEKMGIELTDKQKLIPVNPNSYASADTKTGSGSGGANSDAPKPKRVIFRATKDQIMGAQKLLKSKSFYTGEETGKLDDATRNGLKKYQDANGLKVTGTLNQLTLEKMGIELTDKQRADAVNGSK